MKILVTGANGYLGQGVVKALLDNGHSVVAADFKTNYVNYTKIKIGTDVVISRDTLVLVHDFSIEAGLLSLNRGNPDNEARFIKNVSIGDGSFVGARCVILPGTDIGKHCIVGAGSVLTGKTYPDYSLIAGNPARVVGDVREWTKKKIDENQFSYGCII